MGGGLRFSGPSNITYIFDYQKFNICFMIDEKNNKTVLKVWCDEGNIVGDLIKHIRQKRNTKPQIYTHV